MKEAYSGKDTQNGREMQDPQIRIEALEPDPTRRGYTQVPNYFKYYWTPLIGHKAASAHEMILSFAHGDKDTCHPSLNRLCAHLRMDHRELTGRKRKIGQSKGIKEYYENGILEVLQEHKLLFVEAHGESSYTRSYTFRVLRNPPLLTPEQLSHLPKLLQESHHRMMERCEADRATFARFLSEGLQGLEQSQDQRIRIEELELNPTHRGYAQIPNYFKHYWTPLIGHKAAAVYEIILSFAHGDKDTCYPSLTRLCAHLGMTRQELIGRERKIWAPGEESKRYREKGVLEVLQKFELLFINIHGESPHTQSYIFRILKGPPFLTPEQLLQLAKPLQQSHRILVERCEADQAKLRSFQASRGGEGTVTRGGEGTVTRGGGDSDNPNKTNNNTTIKQQQQNAAPTHHPVVVVSCPQEGAKNADALAQLPRVIHIQDNIPGLTQSDNAPPPSPLILTGNSLFTVLEKRITSELVPQYRAELVQQYIDWLDFQYRDQPPKKPFTLLAVSLARGNLIRPEGFEDREELERRRLEKERQQEAARQEEEKKRKEAEANQEKLAQAQALFESMPEGEKEVWWQRAIRELPVFLRSMSSIVENQIHLLILKELKPEGHDFPERTGEETTEQKSASAGDNSFPVSPAP